LPKKAWGKRHEMTIRTKGGGKIGKKEGKKVIRTRGKNRQD